MSLLISRPGSDKNMSCSNTKQGWQNKEQDSNNTGISSRIVDSGKDGDGEGMEEKG